jgi:hypothetical protein
MYPPEERPDTVMPEWFSCRVAAISDKRTTVLLSDPAAPPPAAIETERTKRRQALQKRATVISKSQYRNE